MMIQKSWHSTMNLAPSTNWYGCPIFQRVEPHLILLHHPHRSAPEASPAGRRPPYLDRRSHSETLGFTQPARAK